jgi:pimeloyl-ACP methyl ester carboxylesterase
VERAVRSRAGHAFVRGTVGAAARRNHLVLTRDLFVATPPETRSGWLSAMQTMDLRDGIARIGIPTTIVVGTRDTLTPVDRARELADTIPGAHLVTIDKAGHMLPLEEPDRLAEAITSAFFEAPTVSGTAAASKNGLLYSSS